MKELQGKYPVELKIYLLVLEANLIKFKNLIFNLINFNLINLRK